MMSFMQQAVTILLCGASSVITRMLPFVVFRENQETPAYVQYLGKALPSAVFGMLVVYCLKNVEFTSAMHGLPEILSIILTVTLHVWKRQMLLSIAAGTVCYMLLVQFVFVL